MSDDADDRILQRFVAGLPVDGDALARAVAMRATERSIVVDALLRSLQDDEPAVRLRIAERAAELTDLAPEVAAALIRQAAVDEDERVRAACADALHAHGLAAPGDPGEAEAAAVARRGLRFPALRLFALTARSGDGGGARTTLTSRHGDPVRLDGRITDDGAGGAVVTVAGLPETFEGTRPFLLGDLGPGPLSPIAEAEEVVGTDRTARFAIAAVDGSAREVARWLSIGELAVFDAS
jgi:hypothetical protein